MASVLTCSCGTPNPLDSNYCSSCGVKFDVSTPKPSPNTDANKYLTESEIQKKLFKYKNTVADLNVCPLCGYKGKLGLLKTGTTYEAFSIPLGIGFFIGFLANSWFLFIIILIAYIPAAMLEKSQVECPNCDKTSYIRLK